MGKRLYSAEFKREALRKVGETGATLSQVAREIGIKQQTLHRWKVQAESGGVQSSSVDSNRELERLRRENTRLKAERDILEKSTELLRERHRREVRLHREASGDMANAVDVRSAQCFWQSQVRPTSASNTAASIGNKRSAADDLFMVILYSLVIGTLERFWPA